MKTKKHIGTFVQINPEFVPKEGNGKEMHNPAAFINSCVHQCEVCPLLNGNHSFINHSPLFPLCSGYQFIEIFIKFCCGRVL